MKKRICILLCVTLLAGLITGCSSNNNKVKGEDEDKQEITVMIPDWGVPNEELLAAFTEETGIGVVINEVGWDNIRDKIAIAASGGTSAADVVEVDWSWVGEFEAAGWLESIELSDEETSDMPTLETFTVNGNVLAVPYANDFRLSYYNTVLYEAAGITEEPNTWNDVYENAKLLNETNTSEYPVAIPLNAEEAATTSLIWLSYTMNGVVFNSDGTLNKESILEALKYEEKLLREGLINPADKTSSGMDTYRRILSGAAAFITGPTSFAARSNNENESSVTGQVVPILVPGHTDKAAQTMALPEAIGITKFSKNKEAAEKFVKWYTSPEIQKKLYETNNTIPTHNKVLEALIEDGTMKNAGAMLEEAKRISSPFPKGVPSYYAEMSNAIYNAVNKMALGQITSEEAFDEMNGKVSELAKR